jgi:hypothetical protein
VVVCVAELVKAAQLTLALAEALLAVLLMTAVELLLQQELQVKAITVVNHLAHLVNTAQVVVVVLVLLAQTAQIVLVALVALDQMLTHHGHQQQAQACQVTMLAAAVVLVKH